LNIFEIMTTKFSTHLTRLKMYWHIIFVPIMLIFTLILLALQTSHAEGSADFLIWQGKRLFLSTDQKQQLKVFAKKGEIINVGASHVGISTGTISVYDPLGKRVATYDGSDNKTAIIFDNIQEVAGPTGGGTKNGTGYSPGIIAAAIEGIYTVTFDFDGYELKKFANIDMQAPWTRAANQPTIKRVVLAYDVTVTQNGAGNVIGSKMLKGRVFTNEHVSAVNENGNLVNPSYYILTKDGYQYYVDFVNVDPWGFPISSNTTGLTDLAMKGAYKSMAADNFARSDDPATWQPNKLYFYEPQAEDYGNVVNNKIFFNPPATDMPKTATVTDIFRKNTHTTWLYSTPNDVPDFKNFSFIPNMTASGDCVGNTTMTGKGGFIKFTSNVVGDIVFRCDMDENGKYYDAVDLAIPKKLKGGIDSIYWDGKLGNGQVVPAKPVFNLNFMMDVQGGEIHIMMFDIENNPGGIKFRRLNGLNAPDTTFYFDHAAVGGMVSGGGTAGNAKSTTTPYTYSNNWGNLKMLDYWAYANNSKLINEKIAIEIVDSCKKIIPLPPIALIDSDNDGTADYVDLDDDNDGISDQKEYCNTMGGGFTCLPSAKDPSDDADKDGIPNYLDANDPAVPNNMADANNDGKCDFINPLYDIDGDQVPDFLDLDADNDGIADLVEAGHNQPDSNGDGVIDGLPVSFGTNGLFDAIDSDKSPSAVVNYIATDFDKDNVPDHDDLDSDNDGIHDLAEQLYGSFDALEDGRIDYFTPNLLASKGLVPTIDPAKTGKAIPTTLDSDKDGVPNWHDFDSDNDGLMDVVEASRPDLDPDNNGMPGVGKPLVNLDGQVADTNNKLKSISDIEDTDNDNTADFLDLDSDNDGLFDAFENDIADPDQNGIIGTGTPVVNTRGVASGATSKPIDTDKDGKPDYRDLDSDNDTLIDATECNTLNCNDLDNDGKPAFRDDDRDGDGLWDGYECTTGGLACVDTDNDGKPDVDDLDSDNDGLPDATECGNQSKNCSDIDGDGKPAFRDIDRDGDGIDDGYECSTKGIGCEDTDKDGIADVDDLDSDNDGLSDKYECGAANNCPDFDGDGKPDFRDTDSDNDGKSDLVECPTGAPCQDNDNDGAPNFRDTKCDKLLEKPTLVYQTPVCTGIININIAQNFNNIDRVFWMNGVGDTLSKSSQKNLTISADNPDAIPPYFVNIIDKDGCRSTISDKADVVANILPNNIALVAKDDNAEGKANTSFIIKVLENDVTDLKNTWTVKITKQPANGKVVITNNEMTYMPNADFSGDDIFEYSICYTECPDICRSAKVVLKVNKNDNGGNNNNTDVPCKVPNILTPNDDGANDFLRIKCVENSQNPNSELMVFDRWGLQVYKASPYKNDWFGTYDNDKLPTGTYYYIFKPDRNGNECQMGYITLLRN
jgi:gliding motility-associated-like protein